MNIMSNHKGTKIYSKANNITAFVSVVTVRLHYVVEITSISWLFT